MQTILGANGIIATELAKELTKFTTDIRLVSRNPKKVNETDQLKQADLLNAQQTDEAVAGSEIVYLTAGLPYDAKIWTEQWPILMQNVLAACLKHKTKLVFFDNVYMYGQLIGDMTETTAFQPTSKKGTVRAKVANMVLQAMENGNQMLIARAPEFYGPRNTVSGINATVFDNIRKGKNLQCLINDDTLKTYIYTPDAGRATALLGNTHHAYNQTWHLPCTNEQVTFKQFVTIIEQQYGKPLPYTKLSKWMIELAGMFNPLIHEAVELLYQSEQDYLFNSDKFKKAFPDFAITSYADGVKEILGEMVISN
jgi:nucleoside-diphosphate-sugar epimerase